MMINSLHIIAQAIFSRNIWTYNNNIIIIIIISSSDISDKVSAVGLYYCLCADGVFAILFLRLKVILLWYLYHNTTYSSYCISMVVFFTREDFVDSRSCENGNSYDNKCRNPEQNVGIILIVCTSSVITSLSRR